MHKSSRFSLDGICKTFSIEVFGLGILGLPIFVGVYKVYFKEMGFEIAQIQRTFSIGDN